MHCRPLRVPFCRSQSSQYEPGQPPLNTNIHLHHPCQVKPSRGRDPMPAKTGTHSTSAPAFACVSVIITPLPEASWGLCPCASFFCAACTPYVTAAPQQQHFSTQFCSSMLVLLVPFLNAMGALAALLRTTLGSGLPKRTHLSSCQSSLRSIQPSPGKKSERYSCRASLTNLSCTKCARKSMETCLLSGRLHGMQEVQRNVLLPLSEALLRNGMHVARTRLISSPLRLTHWHTLNPKSPKARGAVEKR